MSDDEIIEKVLSFLVSRPGNGHIPIGALPMHISAVHQVRETLAYEKLATLQLLEGKYLTHLRPTQRAREIVAAGGWIKHCQDQAKHQRLVVNKDKDQAILIKLQLSVFWWVFGFAFIGSILGILAFLGFQLNIL